MKILSVNEYCQYLTEMAVVRKAATEVDDFFEMLDPRTNTLAYVYYAKSMDSDLAKTFNGKRMPNPMLGRFFKTIVYKFQFGKTYMEELKKANPDIELDPNAPMNQENRRLSGFTGVEGYKFVRENKKGELNLPVINPKVHKSNYYMIDDDGELVECGREDIVPYMTPSKANPKPSAPSQFNRVDMRSLYVDKIYMLNASGKTWKNPSFIFPILAPTFGK